MKYAVHWVDDGTQTLEQCPMVLIKESVGGETGLEMGHGNGILLLCYTGIRLTKWLASRNGQFHNSYIC